MGMVGPFERAQVIVELVDQFSARAALIGRNTENMNTKFKSLVVGVSGLATAAVSLYMNFDRIQHSQVALDRANLMVKRSTETLDQATKTYNETVLKYGYASAEAKDATDKLAIAQEGLTVATERQQLAQENVSQTMLTFAVSIVPTMITGIASLNMVLKEMGYTLTWAMGPFGLLVGLLVGLGTTIYNMIGAWQAWQGHIDAVNDLLTTHNDLLRKSAGLVVNYAEVIRIVNETLPKLRGEYDEVIKKIEALNAEMESAGKYQGRESARLDMQRNALIKLLSQQTQLNTAIGQEEDLLKKATDALQAQIDMWKEPSELAPGILDIYAAIAKAKIPHLKPLKLFEEPEPDIFDKITSALNLDKAKDVAANYVDAFRSAWESGMAVSVLSVANQLAMDTEISVDAAIQILRELSDVATEVTDPIGNLFDQLQSHWNLDRAEELGDKYVQAYAKAWKSGYMVSVMQVAKKFADDMNISIGDAIRILDELMNKLKPEEDRTHKGPFTEWNEAARSYEWTLPEGTLPAPTITPISTSNDVTININAPLVNIAGSADRRTAVIAAETIKESLRNVIVEASSTAADATHKQIRAETTVTTGIGKVGNIYGGPGYQKRWVQQ